MAFKVYLDGFETASETMSWAGTRIHVAKALRQALGLSLPQCRDATEGVFPKVVARFISRDDAENVVRCVGAAGGYLRCVDEDEEPPEQTCWDRLVADD